MKSIYILLVFLSILFSSTIVFAATCSSDGRNLIDGNYKKFCGIGYKCQTDGDKASCIKCETNGGEIKVLILHGNADNYDDKEYYRHQADLVYDYLRFLDSGNVKISFEIIDVPVDSTPHDTAKVIVKMDDVLKNSDKNDMVLFFYVGHGSDNRITPDVNYYSISSDRLEKLFDKSKANTKVMILGGCKSGSIVKHFQSKGKQNIIVVSSTGDDSGCCSNGYLNFPASFSSGLLGADHKGGIFSDFRDVLIRTNLDMSENRICKVHDNCVNFGFMYPRSKEIPNFCK